MKATMFAPRCLPSWLFARCCRSERRVLRMPRAIVVVHPAAKWSATP